MSVESSAKTPLVSIVIVTYNAVDYVRRCLESIRRHTPTAHEIIVVDNASERPTREYLSEQHGIRLFLNEANLLWSAGCNQGLREADPASRYLLLLNPDTEVHRADWLEVMIRILESGPRVGLTGTKHHYRESGPVYGWIDGQCLMLRRECLEDVGPLECERFPMGGAPQLFTIRAFRKGWTYRVVHPSDHLIDHHRAKSREELKGPVPWKEERIDFEGLMREEGLTPEPAGALMTYLRRRFYSVRTRGRFFGHPPVGPIELPVAQPSCPGGGRDPA